MRKTLAAAIALMVSAAAHAQDGWPQRAVTLVVPFGAGGAADLTARIISAHLQARLGAPFVIETKGGAGGSLGAGFVAKAPNDGYTLLVGTVSSNAVNAALYTRLAYDLDRDFQPVSRLVQFSNLLFANPKIPAPSVTGLIPYLIANLVKVNYASTVISTSPHCFFVNFSTHTENTIHTTTHCL